MPKNTGDGRADHATVAVRFPLPYFETSLASLLPLLKSRVDARIFQLCLRLDGRC